MSFADLVNIAISVLVLAFLSYQTWLIFRRNRRVVKAAHDDFFLLMMVVLAILFVLPLTNANSTLEALRNTLILLSVFTTFAIKRGFNDKGVVKVFFTVPWDKIDRIQVDSWQSNKAAIYFYHGRWRMKLLVNNFRLEETLTYIAGYCPEIMLDQSLETKMNSYIK